MDVQKRILQQFENDVEQEGLFWRMARLDTFIDLLMLQAGKASKNGIDEKLALSVILIALKALVNTKLGVKDYSFDYKRLNKELFNEKGAIYTEVHSLVSVGLGLENEAKKPPLYDESSYLEVLNNLNIDNYSLEVFENVLLTFLSYLKSKTKD
jgi:hypothetical protein